MFLAVSLASLVLLLLMAALSVAWLALPGGRFCPRCGGPSHPVRLRRWVRPLDRILQWRWCAECGWEGLGRPPKAPNPGERFHWRRPDPRRSPVFQWQGDDEPEAPADPERKVEPRGGGEPPAPTPPPPHEPAPGFRWRPPRQGGGAAFHWGGAEEERGPSRTSDGLVVRFFRWLRKGKAPGFRWRDPGS